MLDLGSVEWLSRERRHLVRPSTHTPVSRHHRGDKKSSRLNVDVIATAIDEFTLTYGLADWDPFYASVELDPTLDTIKALSDLDIARLNKAVASVSDGVIIHHQGFMLAQALCNSRCVPVLLVADTEETVSRALLGLEEMYRNFTIRRFDGPIELASSVGSWLEGAHSQISDGPAVRRAIETGYGMIAQLLAEAWAMADDETKHDAERVIPQTGVGLDTVIRLVTPIADLPAHSLFKLIEILGIRPDREVIARNAPIYLHPQELESWGMWKVEQNADLAWQVLGALVEERAGMSGRPANRDTPAVMTRDSWDVFTAGWMRRADR
jgi:hypothetical protein